MIRHFAGKVMYDTDGFLDKNRGILPLNLKQLLKSSTLYMELMSGLSHERVIQEHVNERMANQVCHTNLYLYVVYEI